MRPYEDTVEKEISELEYNDLVEIRWIDASRLAHVLPEQLDDNRFIAVYKKVVGYVHAVKIDKLYHRKILVLTFGSPHRKRYDAINIPVGTITQVKRLRPTEKIRTISNVGTPYLATKHISNQQDSEGVGDNVEEGEEQQ